jgi:hypothetical protein
MSKKEKNKEADSGKMKSKKHEYDDQASLKNRKFVPEKY